jgi:hypothetical protein
VPHSSQLYRDEWDIVAKRRPALPSSKVKMTAMQTPQQHQTRQQVRGLAGGPYIQTTTRSGAPFITQLHRGMSGTSSRSDDRLRFHLK